MTFWLAGHSFPPYYEKDGLLCSAWELIGLYSTQDKAVEAAKPYKNGFTAALELDTTAPVEATILPDLTYLNTTIDYDFDGLTREGQEGP